MPLLVPGGEALWLASNSCSVIGRVIGHGELVDVSVTGGHEVAAAADVVILPEALDAFWKSTGAMARHCAIAIVSKLPLAARVDVADCGARPPEPPVSSTNVLLSDTRVKVNFG